MNSAGFAITQGHGFQITFENGYTVSVQFGELNYCNNARFYLKSAQEMLKKYTTLVHPYQVNIECDDAEVAVISPFSGLLPMPEFGGDTVGAHFTPEMVFELIDKVRKMK